jgi:hypothetical protein
VIGCKTKEIKYYCKKHGNRIWKDEIEKKKKWWKKKNTVTNLLEMLWGKTLTGGKDTFI